MITSQDVIKVVNVKKLLWIFFLIGILFLPAPSAQANGCWRNRSPYGDYCRGPRRGWYGERKPVITIEDARKIIKEHLAPFGDARIDKIEERAWYYEAEIRNKDNKLIDKVIVNKRTGRIRSIL